MAFTSALSLKNRFTQLTVAAIFLIFLTFLWTPSLGDVRHVKIPGFSSKPNPPSHNPLPPKPGHPIDFLIEESSKKLAALEAKETKTIRDAAQAYRERRGRQPPPGFDEWFTFAQKHSAVMVEDFFDQIYHDLGPFWGVPAKQIREQAHDFEWRVSVRNGNASTTPPEHPPPWVELWHNLTSLIASKLPDLDMPINVMDESRIVVDWAEIDGYMTKAKETQKIVPGSKLKTTYQSLKDLDENPPPEWKPEFLGGPLWPLYVKGCPPGSPATKMDIETDFSTPPSYSDLYPKNSHEGYVKNWTFATSPCENPHIQGLHGTFIEPVSVATTKTFFPLFGGSKLPMNNEILLPPAMYWTDNPFYSGGESHGTAWEDKIDNIIWRGAATGGRNRPSNWRRFQRHRFISMINGTTVKAVETGLEKPPNFILPAKASYDIATWRADSKVGSFGDWVASWSDASLGDLLCSPEDDCSYVNPYFKSAGHMDMKEQYSHKFLPDIDGNSYSGRYRGFLRSTSLPIKATIYREWHDSRLVPWQHFVPMDNTFIDIYGIMEYLTGNEQADVGAHDAAAKKIAMDGKAWAEKVLRREDMEIYVYRLLLEYARVCDDDREIMGFKEDVAR